MRTLSKYPDDALRAELERREQLKSLATPVQLESPDLTALRKLCQYHIDAIASGSYVDEDFSHYVYEEAMQTIFGKDVFAWINQYSV